MINQTKLAKALDVERQTVSGWARGVNMPAQHRFPDIAKVLGVPIEALFTEPEPQPPKVIQIADLIGPIELDQNLNIPDALELLGEVCAGNGLHPAETVELHIGNGVMMEPQTVPIGAALYQRKKHRKSSQVFAVCVAHGAKIGVGVDRKCNEETNKVEEKELSPEVD
jgi:transcriptional regulator with XRE-family HTH domain